MSLRVIFAPNRMLKWCYQAEISVSDPKLRLNDKGKVEEFFHFEKFIAKGLAKQAEELFPKKNVTLIGYDYKQYDRKSFSYYPVQLVLSGKYQGVIWIKWKCENYDDYFLFNSQFLSDMETLPSSYEFCSNEENAMLFERFPQPRFADNLCKTGKLKFLCSPGYHIGPTIWYEIQSQITERAIQMTGINDIQKYLGIYATALRADNIDGYSYCCVWLHSNPYWEIDHKLFTYIRWKSNTNKEYITTNDIVNSGDITVEFSPTIPPEDIKIARKVTKELLISYINSNPHKPNQLAEYGFLQE